MKKTLSIILAILMIVTVIPLSVFSASAATENITVTIDTGASVTIKDSDADSYYEIGTADELYAFAAAVNSGKNAINGELTANITVNQNVLKADGSLNGNGSNFRKWIPIGEYIYDYYGNFEGNNKIVSGLYFNDSTTEYNVGMFGLVRNNEIRNLGVVDSYFCGNNGVGGITGRNFDSFIKRCYSINTIIGNSYVGGITGHATFTLDHCFYIGQISGNKDVGAIAGYLSPILSTCYYLNTNPFGGRGVAKTAEEFASGEIAVLLGGGFGQDIDNGNPKQAYPSFDGAPVYAIKNCADENIGYTNYAEKAYVDHEFNDDKYCVICGFYKPPKGGGTADNPYHIGNLDELYWFADQVNSGNTKIHAKLTADITINTGVLKADGTRNDNYADFTNWKSIGGVSTYLGSVYQYEGTFDGNGKTISGIHCENNTDHEFAGLFACIGSKGKVINLTIKDSYFFSRYNPGSIAGANYGTIENCHNYSNVYCASTRSGGIVGINYKTISNCANHGVISGAIAAGIAGENQGTITECYNEGFVSPRYSCGGITGINNGTVSYCYNIGTIEGNDDTGGIAGKNSNKGKITYCYNAGIVQTYANNKTNTESNKLHAIVNINEGTVSDCYYDKNVTIDVGMNNSGTCKNIQSFTTQEFASGKVASLLGAPFGQDIDNGKTKQTYPVLSSATVYYGYNTCDQNADKIYSNNASISENRLAHTCKTGSNKCTVCGKENVHIYEEQTRMDATCSAQGIIICRCTSCGDEYYEILDSLSHKMTYTYDHSLHKGVCETCGYTVQGAHNHSESCICVCGKTSDRKYDHNYRSVYTRPTCTEDGYYTYTCDVCGDSYTEIYSSSLGHWGGEATCTEKAICVRCGEPYGDEPAGHMEDYDDGDCLTPICCWVCGEVTTPARTEHEWCEENYCVHCYTGKPFVFRFMDGETELFTADVEALTYHTFRVTQNKGDYAFIGWDGDGDGVADYSGPDLPYDIYVEGDMTFYAVYQKIDYVIIRYYRVGLDSGEYEISNIQRIPVNETVYLDYDYAYWYTPLGWATEPSGEKVYDYGQEITVTETLDLYTVYEPFAITFDLGEGATWLDENGNPVPERITEDTSFTTVPTKPGYRFLYFIGYDMYGSEITFEFYTDEETGEGWMWVSLYGTMTITAVWEECTEHSYINGKCPCGEVVFKLKNGALINNASGYIYGLDAGTTSLDGYTDILAEGYEWTYTPGIFGTFGTGTKATLTNGESIIAEYTVLIYGDLNGDSWYDGDDAFLANLIFCGMLTEESLPDYMWAAADCNHDGAINDFDVDLLMNAGLRKNDIDQNSGIALSEQTAYIEYASLIDQSAGLSILPDIDYVQDDATTPDAGDSASETVDFTIIFTYIFSFIQKILSWILSLITA